MAGRHFQLSNGSLFLTWLIAAVVILLLPTSVTRKGPLFFQQTFQPLLAMGRQAQLAATATPAGDDIARTEYDKLWKDYQNLHARLMKLHADYETLSRLRSGLPQPFSELVLAEVTASSNSLSHEIVINRGTDAGVREGRYVLSAGQNSVVGIVHQTRKQLAKAMLLTDPRQKIPVQIGPDDGDNDTIGGLMVGNGKNACRIANIKRERTVAVGDPVFARAYPGLLNVPVILGTVAEVRPDDKHPLLWEITVRPVEDLARLTEVAVIVVEDF